MSAIEIEKMIKNLKNSHAAGPDMITNIMLKKHARQWAILIEALLKTIQFTKLMPESWLEAIVVPIFKRGNRAIPNNYRPIALLDTIGKILHSFLRQKLEGWASHAGILDIRQTGFTKGVGVEIDLLILTILKLETLQTGKKLFLAFIDLRQAFDMINRDLLWTKLQAWNCPIVSSKAIGR